MSTGYQIQPELDGSASVTTPCGLRLRFATVALAQSSVAFWEGRSLTPAATAALAIPASAPTAAYARRYIEPGNHQRREARQREKGAAA